MDILRYPLKRTFKNVTYRLANKKINPPNKLKICILSYRSNPFCGGQGVYVKYLSKALCDLGHQVDVISGEPYPDLFEGVKLIPLPGMNFYGYSKTLTAIKERKIKNIADLYEVISYNTGGFPEPLAFSIRAANFLSKKSTSHKNANTGYYHIVHDNQCLSYGLLRIKKKFPLVATIHHPITRDLKFSLGHEKDFFLKLLIKRWHSFVSMQKRVAKRLPHIITVSETSKKDICKDFHMDPGKISVIYNGVDFEKFRPIPHIDKDPFRIITTASADVPLKGLNYLIKAMAHVTQKIPQANLTVIGRPKKGGSTEKLINEFSLNRAVRFVFGLSEEEMVKEYARASLAVSPSLYEGFGLPAAEAMACEKPIVSTTGGALKEVVGDAGILVPPADHMALGNAILYLFEHPYIMDKLGKKARKRIIEKFNWKLAAKKTVKVYEEALSTHVNR